MAVKVENPVSTPYDKIEKIVMEQVFSLETENAQLKSQLTVAQAKLEVYERIASVSGTKTQLGFGPPINREEG